MEERRKKKEKRLKGLSKDDGFSYFRISKPEIILSLAHWPIPENKFSH